MSYRVELVRSAERELHALPVIAHRRVAAALLRLGERTPATRIAQADSRTGLAAASGGLPRALHR